MKREKNYLNIFIRYLIILIIGLIFYFTPIADYILLMLTIYPISFLLDLFFESFVHSNYIFLESIVIEIIPACVAVSAYFLLLILNLTTPMKKAIRARSLIFSLLLLLVINISRIFILSVMLINDFSYFDITHKVFWYVLSILIVVGIWFLTVYRYKIKAIPGYTDLIFLKKQLNKSKAS